MAGTTKEILFSARDNGVESTMSRLRRSAKELSSDLMREASASANSQKDVLKNYEEQIKLIESRNRLDAEGARIDAKDRLDRRLADPSITPQGIRDAKSEYGGAMNQIKEGSKADEMQVRLLREIADTIKVNGRLQQEQETRMQDDEARSAGGGLTGGGTGRNVARRGDFSDPEYRRSVVASVSRQMDVAGYLMGVQQMMSASSGSQALMGMGGAMMGMGGAVGKVGLVSQLAGTIGEIANMSNDAAASIHKSYTRAVSVGGGSPELMKKHKIGDSAFAFGFTRDEYMNQFLTPTMQSRGSTRSSVDYSMDAMTLHRGTGLDVGTIMALEKMQSRGMRSGTGINSMDAVARMIDAHRGTDAFGGKRGYMDLSRLQESMDEFVSMQQTIMMRSGDLTGMGTTLHASQALERMGGVYKNDQYKFSTIQAIDRGLSAQSSPEAMGIKMGILRKAMPEATRMELMAEMDKGIESEHLMRGLLQFVANTGGDRGQRQEILGGLLGGQVRNADIVRLSEMENMNNMYAGFSSANSMYSSNFSIEEDIKGRSSKSVSSEMRSQIERQQRLDDAKADPFGTGGKEYADYLIQGFGNKIDGLADAMQGWF